MSRWLKKKKHEANIIGNPTSYNRLAIQEASEACREVVDKLMNSLEKEFDEKQVKDDLQSIEAAIINIKMMLEPMQAELKKKRISPSDTGILNRVIDREDDEKRHDRLKRKYDNVTDRKIIDMLFK